MKRCIFALALGLISTGVSAAMIQVAAIGTIYYVADPDALLPFDDIVVNETTVTVRFKYDPNAPNRYSVAGRGAYDGIQEFIVAVGDVVRQMPQNPGASIYIADDQISDPAIGEYWDYWNADSNYYSVSDEWAQLHLVRSEFSTTVPPLTSPALVEPVWPGDWELGRITFHVLDDTQPIPNWVARLDASIDSLSTTVVPVPAALWFFGFALGLLGAIRRAAV